MHINVWAAKWNHHFLQRRSGQPPLPRWLAQYVIAFERQPVGDTSERLGGNCHIE
jgi:hypothetical protein